MLVVDSEWRARWASIPSLTGSRKKRKFTSHGKQADGTLSATMHPPRGLAECFSCRNPIIAYSLSAPTFAYYGLKIVLLISGRSEGSDEQIPQSREQLGASSPSLLLSCEAIL